MNKHDFQTSTAERLSYGGFFLGQNIFYLLQLQFLSYFYTEYVGIKIPHATMMLLLVKIWDACNDPIMGAIVDKCNFKKGKYLPWLKFVTYVLPLAVLLLFVNINSNYTLKLIFAYFSYIIFDTVYTISDSPLFSLSTVMTSSVYERDTLISYGRMASAVAVAPIAVFMSVKKLIGWTPAAAAYCFVSFLLMLPLQFKARERVHFQRSEDITFRKIFIYLFKNKYLLIYYLGYFAIEATNTMQVMAIYFANSNLHNESMFNVIMAVVILPVIVISPFLPALIGRFGKKKLTVFCSIAVIVMSVIQYEAGYDNFALFLSLAAVRVAFMQVPLLIYGMFTADCIEYGAYINGERTEGIAFSIQTFVTKLGGAITNALCLWMLGCFGYVEQAAIQSAQALHGIWIIISLVPAAGYIIMLVIMKFYKLDEKMVAEMMAKNQEKLGKKDI